MIINFNNEQEVKLIPVFEGIKPEAVEANYWEYLTSNKFFSGKKAEVYSDLKFEGKNIVLLGLGKEEEFEIDTLRVVYFKAAKELKAYKKLKASTNLDLIKNFDKEDVLKAAYEGLLMSDYVYDKHKTEKKEKLNVEVSFIENFDKKEENLKEITNIMEAIFLTRDLVNEPNMTMTPEIICNIAKEQLEPLGVEVEILGKKEIEALNMHAFLSVSKGSAHEPKFLIMKYLPVAGEKPITLVGKGIAYDSGGYSIKPSNSMSTMFTDMTGGATVIGTMYAAAKNKLNKNLVCVSALCENLISGEAYKPGDIIGSMKGTTIEVDNTDAEGRVTLADSLYYAATKVDSKCIIDIATLTGAIMVALGYVYTGAMTNNDELLKEFDAATKKEGEKIWQMPIDDIFREAVKSKRADLINVGGPAMAGSITAATFLEHFVEGKPWLHLDIAGTSYLPKPEGYLPEGATGVHVKSLYRFVKESK